jgi:hypothetical protein
MPTLTVTKSYSNGTVLSESHLDDIKSSVETFVNTTKLGSDNLQAGAVGTTQLDSAAVTTAKIANNSVTDSKLSSSGSTDADRAVNTNHIKDVAVTTAKIADSNVTTAKIADGAITKAKLEAITTGTSVSAGGVGISGSSGNFITSNTSPTDVTNLSITITTVGRPVQLRLESTSTASSGSSTSQISTGGTSNQRVVIMFLRDSTVISTSQSILAEVPPSSFAFLDTPSAGTYTYKVRAYISVAGPSINILNTRLVAYEI